MRAAVDLLEDGNTLPFIARYRKEATKGLDETALRTIEDRLTAAKEMEARKATILKTIAGQGLLTAELRRQIEDCNDKRMLEDLYLPFKPKRRTRATVARERGLQGLADLLVAQERLGRSRQAILREFVDPAKDVPDEKAALEGACDIVAEVWSENAETRNWLMHQALGYGHVHSHVKRGKKESGRKFETYFSCRESVKRIPSHRFLAMKRGESEGVLRIDLELDDDFVLRTLRKRLLTNRHFEFSHDLNQTVEDAYTRLMLPATESAVVQQLKQQADEEAIRVFATNLRDLLLAPPAGPRSRETAAG